MQYGSIVPPDGKRLEYMAMGGVINYKSCGGRLFNGEGKADVPWQQTTTGTLVEWQMDGAQIVSSPTVTSAGAPIAPASSWQVQAKPTDFA